MLDGKILSQWFMVPFL